MIKRALTTTLLFAAATAAAPRALAQEPPPEAKPAEVTKTTTAAEALSGVRLIRDGRLLVIPASADVLRLQSDVINAAWKSEAGKRALKELGPTEQAARDALEVSAFGGGGGVSIQLAVSLPRDTPDARQAAARFLDALTGKIVPDVAVEWIHWHHRRPLMAAEHAANEARREAEQAMIAAVERRREVRDAAKVLDPSPDAVRGTAARLDAEKQRITLELAGQSARQKALEERVAKLGESAAARVGKDPVAAELEKIVQLREEEVRRGDTLRQAKSISEGEIGKLQAQVAEAKARLFERRESVAKLSGTDLLGDLNKELVTLTITIAENEARLRHVDERLQGLAKPLDLVDSLEQLQGAASRAQKNFETAETRLRANTQNARSVDIPTPVVQWEKPTVQNTGGAVFGGH
jgi:hypothetical protein